MSQIFRVLVSQSFQVINSEFECLRFSVSQTLSVSDSQCIKLSVSQTLGVSEMFSRKSQFWGSLVKSCDLKALSRMVEIQIK